MNNTVFTPPTPDTPGTSVTPGTQGVQVNLAVFAQIITLVISVLETLYFGYHFNKNHSKRPVWEPVWVSSVECISYIILLATGSYRFEMADGSLINVTSSISWALACPVCMAFLTRIAWPEAPPRVNLALIMIVEAVLLIGMLSGMTSDTTMKTCFFTTASILFAILVGFLMRGMFFNKIQRGDDEKQIFTLFVSSWLIFPIGWALGPNGVHSMSYETTLVLFAFGDLLAKNTFSYVGFRQTMALLHNNADGALTYPKKQAGHADIKRVKAPTIASRPTSGVDPLTIARIIEHLEEGSTLRAANRSRLGVSSQGALARHTGRWDTVAQPPQPSSYDTFASFPSTFAEGAQMIGVSKNIAADELKFSVLSCGGAEEIADGSSVTNVCALNGDTGEPFEFMLVRSAAGKSVYCNKFSSIKKNSMVTPPQGGRQNVWLPLEAAMAASPGSAIPNKFFTPLPLAARALGKEASSSSEGDGPYPIPVGPLYAWKDRKPKRLIVESSKIIQLDADKEANTIVASDSDGNVEAFVIVTKKEAGKSREVVSCKYDNFTTELDYPKADLYPELNIRSERAASSSI